MVASDREEVFVRHLLTNEGEYSGVPIAQKARVGKRVKRQVLRNQRINRDIPGRKRSAPRTWRRNCRDIRYTSRLANPLIIPEYERPVLDHRATCGYTKLIPAEWRCRPLVEEVARVQSAVSKEFIGGPMKVIPTRPGRGVDDTARGSSVCGRIIGSEYRKFLNRIHAEISSQHTSGSTVGIVIDTDAVDTIVVLLRTSTGDRQLSAKAAIAATVSGSV